MYGVAHAYLRELYASWWKLSTIILDYGLCRLEVSCQECINPTAQFSISLTQRHSENSGILFHTASVSVVSYTTIAFRRKHSGAC